MSSRVIKPVSTKTIKNQKESINKIATMVDLLNLNGIMIKHRSQEIYLNKNSQNDKSNNSYLLTENNKQTSQQEFSQKNQKNKNALSPRFMSPYNQKAKIISNEKKKTIHNKKASLEKIMSDNDSCQEIESDEDDNKLNEFKSESSSDSEIIDERDFEIGYVNEDYYNKIKQTKFPTLSSNPFMENDNNKKEDDNNNNNINENNKTINTNNSVSYINVNCNKNNNNINKDNINNINNHNIDIYRNLLLNAKKGDRELFISFLDKVLSLPNKGGNINYIDENGNAAIHYACAEGNLKIAEILIKTNCDCNIRTNEKKTPLHFAAIHGYFDISKLLIENGAILNSYDNEKNTPLHYCSMNGHLELLKYFLGKFPHADIENIYGKTPLDVAKTDEIKQLLNEYVNKKENAYHKIKIHNTTDTTMKNLIQKISHKNNSRTQKVFVQTTQNNININIQTNINNNNNTISNTSSNLNTNDSIRKSANKTQLKKTTTINNNNSLSTHSTNKLLRQITINSNGMRLSNPQNISKKNSISNFTLHTQFSNRKVQQTKGNTIDKSNVSSKTNSNNTINLNNTNNSKITTPINNLHKTKTLQKFTLANPLTKSQKITKPITSKKLAITTQEEKPSLTNNSINMTSTSLDASLSRLNKTEGNIKRSKITENNNIHHQISLNSIEEERITPSSFVCLAMLGRGSFGEVYLVQKINSGIFYAMKVLSKDRIMGQNLLKYAMAERNVLSLSNHPFIVKLNFAFQTSSKLFLILDYCPGGDLSKHLYYEKRFKEQRAKFYICEVLLALEDLHKRDIIFRDLKPDNVVLDSDGHCKLTDFGLSKEGVFDSQSAKSFCGSIAYLAPEMLKKQGHGKAVDWYLLGVLFYEMLVGIPPFFTEHKEEIFHNIEYGQLQIPKFVSKDVSELLKALLQRDPNKRLGSGIRDAMEIREHKYFKDVNWNDVYLKKIKPPVMKNYKKVVKMYNRPRLFATDDNDCDVSDVGKTNMLSGWSFINNDEL